MTRAAAKATHGGKTPPVGESLARAARKLSSRVDRLTFRAPVAHVYNPLNYARKQFEAYLTRYAQPGCEAVLLGMNPGPWGMAQTGVPFGEVAAVRDWLQLRERIDRPAVEHPKRAVLGLDCPRSEVSGARIWGWAKQRFGSPAKFFRQFFIANYCPLAFLEESGRNRTPDKLPADEREPLFAACDGFLRELIDVIQPKYVIGVGNFAEKRARETLEGRDVTFGRILHPSPASPKANTGWAKIAESELVDIGITFK